jgi:hypothetical protein
MLKQWRTAGGYCHPGRSARVAGLQMRESGAAPSGLLPAAERRKTRTKFCIRSFKHCILLFFFLASTYSQSVLGIRIRVFLDLPGPDPIVRGTDPDPNPSLFSF